MNGCWRRSDLGLDNADAARYGFLLATPPILAAGIYKLHDLTGPQRQRRTRRRGDCRCGRGDQAVITLRFVTRYFEDRNLIPFGIYCICFGAFMIVFIVVSGAP